MFTWLISRFLFPLHEKLKGHSSHKLKKSLTLTQFNSPEDIKAQQAYSLYKFLRKITKSTHFYGSIRNELTLSDEQLKHLDILQRFPIATKSLIRDNEASFISNKANGLKFMKTSGSSGQPFRFGLGIERISHDIAAKWRSTNWWGVDIGDREAVIWGSDIELGGQSLIKRCRDALFRSKLFPAQHLDEAGIERLFVDLQDFNPVMIYAYPSIMTLLANYAKKHGVLYQGQSLKVIFCTAEKLYEHQRTVIQEVFGVPVANGYGSRDAGFIAHECPQGGMHISAEDIIVEVVDEDGKPCQPGEIGRLLVTHTRTSDFPMVRYDTGDLAKLSTTPCACGRGLPCFDEVVGRSNDVLYSEFGSAVHGAYIGNIIREDDAICQFQLIQESAMQFTLSLVAYPNACPDIEELMKKLKTILGASVNLEVNLLANIAAEPSGKYKYIINRVQKNSEIEQKQHLEMGE
ncbi:phenylacetate--CoA ligase family protein [Thalassotalea montiporae]